MTPTVYDQHAAFYLDFVDSALANDSYLWPLLLRRFGELLGPHLEEATVCDIACGEGYLSRFLAKEGPRQVIGIDISECLIQEATKRGDHDNLTYRVDDAQTLATIEANSIDVAVSQMAIMDIGDHKALFKSVRRVLTNDGLFMFSMLHPCFETPYYSADEPTLLFDENNAPKARVAYRYTAEGFWKSGTAGVRGHMGAHHRTLSTIFNDLIAANLTIERIEEPVLPNRGLLSEVPTVMIVLVRAT